MDPGHQAFACGSSIPFTFEKIPFTAFGSNGLHQSKVRAKLLSLFPTKAAFKRWTRNNSVRSFSGEATQQINEQESRAVVASRGASEFESVDGSVPSLASSALALLTLGGLQEQMDVQTPFRNASASVRKSKRSALSRASAMNAPRLSLTGSRRGSRSDPTTKGRLGARAVRKSRPSARPGPRKCSSCFKGVTHYKRTGRWEAHIWNKRKQIYLGASSSEEKAARAYDRAAIYFRSSGAELNFHLKEYEGELWQLVQLSDSQLVRMLRKQSAGQGTVFPEYPPITELQEPPRDIGAPRYFTVRKRVDQVEPIPHMTRQIDSELVPNRIDGACSSFVRTMVQSDQAQGATFHLPQPANVSKRSRQ